MFPDMWLHRHSVLTKALRKDYRFTSPLPENMVRTKLVDTMNSMTIERQKEELSHKGRLMLALSGIVEKFREIRKKAVQKNPKPTGIEAK